MWGLGHGRQLFCIESTCTLMLDLSATNHISKERKHDQISQEVTCFRLRGHHGLIKPFLSSQRRRADVKMHHLREARCPGASYFRCLYKWMVPTKPRCQVSNMLVPFFINAHFFALYAAPLGTVEKYFFL